MQEYIMNIQTIEIKNKFETLKRIGLATKYFPCYINLTPKLHKVDVLLLSFIVKGQGVHLMDGEKFLESGTSLSITHYNQNHSILTSPEGIEIVNIMLDLNTHTLPKLPEPLASVLPDILPLHPHFDNRLTHLRHLHFDEPKKIIKLVMLLHYELNQKKPGYETAAIDLFRLFLIECARQVMKTGVIRIGREFSSSYCLEKVRHYIDSYYHQQVRLEQLAKISGLSKNYLCFLFKKYSGKTIFNYIIERRIQNAIIQLLSTRKKVISIATDCGFNDLSYFNRSFKKIVGQSPSNYRKSNINW
jgi:AraC-like DNA-binding protein